MSTNLKTAKKLSPKPFRNKHQKRVLFYILMIALPLLQFLVLYVGVNLNSILLAFAEHRVKPEGGYETIYFGAGFDNFKAAFEGIKNSVDGAKLLRNSAIMLACNIFISLPLAVLFSFYIYKNFFGSKVFKVALFVPQIVSVMVFSVLFRYLTTDVVQALSNNELLGGWLKGDDESVRLMTIILYNIWISFGVNVIMITGSMSSVNPSLVEASHLDGANTFQEFWHVTLPLIWPTFTTFVVVSLTGFFVDQMNLYGLFSATAPAGVKSFGYILFIEGQSAGLNQPGIGGWGLNFYQLSALGLTFTLILVPIVMSVRFVMRRLGPSVD